MKVITVNGTEYKIEFSFEAAEHKDLVQKMFNVVSGVYFVKHTGMDIDEKGFVDNNDNKMKMAGAVVDGVSEMVAEIPHICVTAFYAGLLENNPKSEAEAKAIMKTYMKENKLSYRKLYEELKKCMEDDGFFDLSGLTEMLEEMNKNIQKTELKK